MKRSEIEVYLRVGTAIGSIANISCVRIANIKILSKVATGELTMAQTMDQMGRTSISMVYSLGWGATGKGIETAALSWIPIIGSVVGGLVGGIVGSMDGSKYGEAVDGGLKAVGKGIKNACKSGGNAVKSGFNKIRGKLRI